jgi:hypothetical protein
MRVKLDNFVESFAMFLSERVENTHRNPRLLLDLTSIFPPTIVYYVCVLLAREGNRGEVHLMKLQCPFCGCMDTVTWQQIVAAEIVLLLQLFGGVVPALPSDGTCPCCGNQCCRQ